MPALLRRWPLAVLLLSAVLALATPLPTQADWLGGLLPSIFLPWLSSGQVRPQSVFTVDTLTDYPATDTDHMSFRRAIALANGAPGSAIAFAVSGRLAHGDPLILMGDNIDIYAANVSGKPTIGLDDTLRVGANCTISGLSMGADMNLPFSGCEVVSCYFGLKLDGTEMADRDVRVAIRGSSTVVGGDTSAGSNRFGAGTLFILGANAASNVVRNNYFGFQLDNQHTLSKPADFAIWMLDGTHDNMITGNRIVAQSGCIEVQGTTTRANLIQGNTIGVNSSGFRSGEGVILAEGTYNNQITPRAGDGRCNVIGNYLDCGIQITAPSHDNLIWGCRIGVDATGGKLPGASGQYGIAIFAGTKETTVGGFAPGEGNWIAGNSQADIVVFAPSGTEGNASGVQREGELDRLQQGLRQGRVGDGHQRPQRHQPRARRDRRGKPDAGQRHRGDSQRRDLPAQLPGTDGCAEQPHRPAARQVGGLGGRQ